MKWCKLALLTLTITVLLSGCGSAPKLSDDDADVYTKINSRYMNMHSYTADVAMVVRSNKTENTYQCRQMYREGGRYRTEFLSPELVAGLVNIVNGTRVFTGFPDTGQTLTLDSVPGGEDDITYLYHFFENYYKAADTSISVTGGGETRHTVLTTEIIGRSARQYTMSLAVDNHTLDPVRLSVMDMAGRETVTVQYSNFQLNPKLDDGLFAIP